MSFTFSLDRPYRTSAGVYKEDGTLVRTLWLNRSYDAGTYTETWDGKDDLGQAVPSATYEIVLIYHNVAYAWEGVVGNSSKNKTGSRVHRIFTAVPSMAIAGNTAYYTDAYAEGFPTLLSLDLTNPQEVNVLPGNRDAGACSYVATDGNLVYWAYKGVYWAEPPTHPQQNAWVAAWRINDWRPHEFAAGKSFGVGRPEENRTNPQRFVFPSVIDHVTSPPAQPHVAGSPKVEPSGLAVQRDVRLLFVAHHNLNAVHVLDKTSGQLLKKEMLARPCYLAAQARGYLWLVHDVDGAAVAQKFAVGNDGSLSPDLRLAGVEQPVALAVTFDDSLVLVADKTSSQVKAFSAADGKPQWTLGQKGGDQVSAIVSNDRFDFSAPWVFLACAPDGSFWVGDNGNFRMLQFDKNRNYVTAIYMIPGHRSYASTVDLNNPTRL
ncbi:MAG: hypothetical protein N3A66_05925, partial [Planctomycetota bacterium]|nr:hypothetical protein [Planctomycetota bacterium]